MSPTLQYATFASLRGKVPFQETQRNKQIFIIVSKKSFLNFLPTLEVTRVVGMIGVYLPEHPRTFTETFLQSQKIDLLQRQIQQIHIGCC